MTKQIMGLVFLVLMMTGCNQRMTEVVIDPNMSPERQERVIEAAEDWFAHVPEARIPIRIGQDAGTGFVTEEHCDLPADHYGWNDQGANVIYLCKNITAFDSQVIRHELGHAMSIRSDHLNDTSAVMNNGECGVSAITEADANYLRQAM